MLDRNYRLWCSFAMTGPSHRVFFCGDTSYPTTFPLFRQIADTLGPFDLSCIPIGAYEPHALNKDAHVNPAEALQIHKDIRSQHSVAIHWGTFALGEEPLDEPPQLLLAALHSERTMLPPFEAIDIGSTIQIEKEASTPTGDGVNNGLQYGHFE
jgi:N-acyl-phosphatidylethanolamine-hydrolysing phospholipase D